MNQSFLKNIDPKNTKALNGVFKNNRLYGYGQVIYANGEVYTGFFKDGHRSGEGHLLCKINNPESIGMEEANFFGMWRANMRTGFGIMEWQDLSRYEGEWFKDKRSHGKMYLTDHTTYVGHFKNDYFHGKAQIIYNSQHQDLSNAMLQSIFENGVRKPFGKITYYDKSVYIGELN